MKEKLRIYSSNSMLSIVPHQRTPLPAVALLATLCFQFALSATLCFQLSESTPLQALQIEREMGKLRQGYASWRGKVMRKGSHTSIPELGDAVSIPIGRPQAFSLEYRVAYERALKVSIPIGRPQAFSLPSSQYSTTGRSMQPFPRTWVCQRFLQGGYPRGKKDGRIDPSKRDGSLVEKRWTSR
jgi:hypothetical protein